MASKETKLRSEIDYYWSTQKWNEELHTMTEDDWETVHQEIFQDRDGRVGIEFGKYDNVQVERAGNGSDTVAPLREFPDLRKFNIPRFLENNIRRMNYQTPTPVQKHAIPFAMARTDVMCCAQTGSGKTASFLVPLFALLPEANGIGSLEEPFKGICDPPALILAPTRELATQIYTDARKFSFHSNFRCCQIYGGVGAKEQLAELARGCDAIVATPGRLIDFIDRGVLTVDYVSELILDEADRMLDMGFEPQVRRIVEHRGMSKGLQKEGMVRHTMMFSATFPQPIQRLAKDFMRNYAWIAVGIVGGACDTITQELVLVEKATKLQTLSERLTELGDQRVLVFVNSKARCVEIKEELEAAKIWCDCINGDLQQSQRETALKSFRTGHTQVLIATDVASRGLDIPDVNYVFNYDIPNDIDNYVHRIGRTGRIGNLGTAVSFVTRGSWGIMDSEIVLKEIAALLKRAGKDVPPWLISYLGSGTLPEKPETSFGGRDYRAGEEGWKSSKWTEKSAGGGGWGDDGWKKDDWKKSSDGDTGRWGGGSKW